MKKPDKAPYEKLLVSKRKPREAVPERRQFSSCMKPSPIIELKTAAMEDHTPAGDLA